MIYLNWTELFKKVIISDNKLFIFALKIRSSRDSKFNIFASAKFLHFTQVST